MVSSISLHIRTFPSSILFACVCWNSAYAAELSGTISDRSGLPVPTARVELYTRRSVERHVTHSDETGRYAFARISAGEYLLEAYAKQLSTGQPLAILIGQRDSHEANVFLDVTAVIGRVVVTATGGAQPLHEIARAVDVLSRPSIDDRAEFSLGEALQVVPGLRVQTVGGPGAYTRIVFRGLRPADTSITVDGFRLRDSATTQGDATPFLETVTLVNPDRVEVLRGTASSLYGTNAIGGVINVSMDEGGGPLHGTVLAEAGGLGMARGQVRLAGGMNHNVLTWSVGTQHVNVRDGIDDRSPARNTGVHGAALYRPRQNTTISGRLWGGDAFSALSETPFAAPVMRLPAAGAINARVLDLDAQRLAERGLPFDYGAANLASNLHDPDFRRSSRFAAGLLRVSQQLTRSASTALAWHRVHTRRNVEDGPAGVRFEPRFRNSDWIRGRTDTLQARTDFVVSGLLAATVGYEWEHESYLNRNAVFPAAVAEEQYRTAASQRSNSMFVQTQTRLAGERLQIGASGRFQSFSTEAPRFAGGTSTYFGMDVRTPPTAWTGDLSASYFHPSTSTKLRAHAGNGYRAPSIFERWGSGYFEGRFTPYGDPLVRPESSIGFDWGVDQYFAGGRLRLSATHFYTNLREQISFEQSGFLNAATDPFGRSSGYVNTRGGISRGVEFTVDAAVSRRFRWLGSYTWTNSDQRRSTVRDNDFFRTPFVVDHQFNGTSMLGITRRLDAALDFVVTSEHAQIYSRRAFLFEGARRADLVVNYRIPVGERNLRLYGKCSNLLNAEYFENGYRTPHAWGVGGMSFEF
jgi:vitamin B12 transporter